MEIGAVKQAFNNELILLKKNLNQAKTQIIHKLTRKAKQLTEKKGPDTLKEKYKRKAEYAVKEVLVLKKIKARDIGRFIVTHTGKLQDYLNKPQINNDKGCARILLHKAMQEKYKFIRNRFSNIPIKDLFMSRNERLKLRKEEKMKKKEKRDRKRAKGLVSAEGDWDVEEVDKKASKTKIDDESDVDDGSDNGAGDDDVNMSHDDENISESEDQDASDQSEAGSDDDDESIDGSIEDASGEGFKISFKGHSDESENEGSKDEETDSDNQHSEEETIPTRPTKKDKKANKTTVKASSTTVKECPSKPIKKEIPINNSEPKLRQTQIANKEKLKKKQKDNTKNKNLQDKIVNKKFKKDSNDTPEIEKKVVDPFFVTSTGENYMSIVEPRQPDEVKEIHKQGNRKLRRAVMFGHAPKIKPRQEFKEGRFHKSDGFDKPGNKFSKFDKPNGFPRSKNDLNTKSKQDNKFSKFEDNRKQRFSDRNERKTQEDGKPEKLHPSWEAKKKQSGILPFQGKKIVFGDS